MVRMRKRSLVLFVSAAGLGFLIGCANECGPRFPLLGRRLRPAEECPCMVDEGTPIMTSDGGPVLIDGMTSAPQPQPAVTTQPVPAPTPRLVPTPSQPQPYTPQGRIKKGG